MHRFHLPIFAYAQGHQTDTSRDPYKYGDDTGLKSQKVTINKVSKMTDSTIREWIFLLILH